MEINFTEILEETDRIPTSGDAACTVAGMLNSFYTQVDVSVKSHDKCVNLQKNIFLHLAGFKSLMGWFWPRGLRFDTTVLEWKQGTADDLGGITSQVKQYILLSHRRKCPTQKRLHTSSMLPLLHFKRYWNISHVCYDHGPVLPFMLTQPYSRRCFVSHNTCHKTRPEWLYKNEQALENRGLPGFLSASSMTS